MSGRVVSARRGAHEGTRGVANHGDPGRHIAGDDGAGADEGPSADSEPRQDDRARADHDVIVHRHASAEGRPRSDMHACSERALMVNRRAVIEDARRPHDGGRGDDGEREDL